MPESAHAAYRSRYASVSTHRQRQRERVMDPLAAHLTVIAILNISIRRLSTEVYSRPDIRPDPAL